MWIKNKEIEEMERKIANYAKKYVPTTFYHQETASLYIYAERLSFSIKKHPEKEMYGLRFGRSEDFKGSVGKGYKQAKSLIELEKKAKEQIDQYYKNRLKLVMEGRTQNIIPKFLHAIYEKQVKRKIELKTEIPQQELTKIIENEFKSLKIKEMKEKTGKEQKEIIKKIEMTFLTVDVYKDVLVIHKKDA